MSDGEQGDGGQGAGGQGGGAAGDLELGAGGGGAGDGSGGGGQGDGGQGGGEASAFYDDLSDDMPDEKTLSDRAWLKNKGYADKPALVKAMRSLESKLSSGNRIEVPGEDASDEEKAAYRAGIGVPDSVDGYKVEIPDGWEEDLALLTPLREAALNAGTPASAFDALAKTYTAQILDAHNQLVAVHDKEKDAVLTDWGAQKDQNLALYQRGMEAFGFDMDKVGKMQVAMGEGGTKFMMDLGLKLGRLSGEDGFIAGARKNFGITAADARNELTRLEGDKEFGKKLMAKDPAAVARHERLIAVIAEDDAAKARAAQAA